MRCSGTYRVAPAEESARLSRQPPYLLASSNTMERGAGEQELMVQAQPIDRPTGPAALIRTVDGHITYWSPEMVLRYGFAAEDALGHVSHQLLRTTSWQDMTEIHATLAECGTWRGGLIHYRADDQPVVSTNHWHRHQIDASIASLVTEVHSDIVPGGSTASNDLADVISALAQELSQPLAAIGGYVGAAQHGLDKPWPNRLQIDEGLARAVAQLARAGAIVSNMRALGAGLRDPRLVQLHTN